MAEPFHECRQTDPQNNLGHEGWIRYKTSRKRSKKAIESNDILKKGLDRSLSHVFHAFKVSSQQSIDKSFVDKGLSGTNRHGLLKHPRRTQVGCVGINFSEANLVQQIQRNGVVHGGRDAFQVSRECSESTKTEWTLNARGISNGQNAVKAWLQRRLSVGWKIGKKDATKVEVGFGIANRWLVSWKQSPIIFHQSLERRTLLGCIHVRKHVGRFHVA
mmetsp:Transcript_20378/g.31039  ORF Transcript_20378/g.31039 Transcript_20378/m.31039 type:complete len:217 (-) Transcript_20378:950-1600(-)